MTERGRRGFTLVELLVVAVIGSFLLMAVYQVLVVNTRIHAVNSAKAQAQGTLAAGMDILFGEIREVSPRGGDVLAMAPDSLTIRTQRTFGLVCATDYARTPPEVTVLRVGSAFRVGDSISIFADNDPEWASDDAWLYGGVHAIDTTTVCFGSQPAQTLTLPVLAGNPDTVRAGAPVRGYERFTYRLVASGGEWYLGRRAGSAGTVDPLVGPVVPGNGVSFRYLNRFGTVTAADTMIAQIEVALRYQSKIQSRFGQWVADSIVTRVSPRN